MYIYINYALFYIWCERPIGTIVLVYDNINTFIDCVIQYDVITH